MCISFVSGEATLWLVESSLQRALSAVLLQNASYNVSLCGFMDHKMSPTCRALFHAISAAAVRLLPSMNSWHVSNLTWSLSVVQHFNETLFAAAFDKIAKEADVATKEAAARGSSTAAANREVVSSPGVEYP
jgi:hypothetical protein